MSDLGRTAKSSAALPSLPPLDTRINFGRGLMMRSPDRRIASVDPSKRGFPLSPLSLPPPFLPWLSCGLDDVFRFLTRITGLIYTHTYIYIYINIYFYEVLHSTLGCLEPEMNARPKWFTWNQKSTKGQQLPGHEIDERGRGYLGYEWWSIAKSFDSISNLSKLGFSFLIDRLVFFSPFSTFGNQRRTNWLNDSSD